MPSENPAHTAGALATGRTGHVRTATVVNV